MSYARRVFASLFILAFLVNSAAADRTFIISENTQMVLQEEMEKLPPNGRSVFTFVAGLEGLNTVEFPDCVEGTPNALPEITDTQDIEFHGDPNTVEPTRFLGFGECRWISIKQQAQASASDIHFEGFGTPGSGGLVYLDENGRFDGRGLIASLNNAGDNGGVVMATGNSHFSCHDCRVSDNSARNYGGGFAFTGSATGYINRGWMGRNSTGIYGCDGYVNTGGTYGYRSAVIIRGCQSVSRCPNTNWEQQFGSVYTHSCTQVHPDNQWDSVGNTYMRGSVFDRFRTQHKQSDGEQSPPEKQDNCNDFGSGAFMSLGYNTSSDGSCNLTDPTDQPSTDPLLVENEEGVLVPNAGSPLIDSGEIDVAAVLDEELASLPCGYRDLLGTARPQDANGDGVFECDRGAVEIAGTGQVVDGHSAAFFNASRDGEGTYVEILNATTAIVYTFTYRPDGSGPAWFIGVGTINGNSIIIDDVLRPIGTSFGDGFNADDVEFTPNGGMSMVFPDCVAAAPGGNVAYSGDMDLGYEGLITRATRLSNITGCGSETPHPNAGLSGSYFDPTRDGEGIIVEWLPNGDVLVVFFTYDENDNQLWLLGIGRAEGNTVTMDALYASTFTKWGRAFNKDEVTIDTWGTFMLTWTMCGGVEFKYNSTVGTYGSATRNYSRLSTLAGTSCPEF